MAELVLGIALAGAIVFAGFLASKLFEATNVPDVLLLIAFGMIVGPILGLVDSSSLTPAMPFFAATALVVIMLAAGQHFNFYRVVSTLPSATVFAFFAYFVSAALITGVAHLVFGWQLLHAAFLAFVLSGSCPTIVGSLVERLRASEQTKISLSLEATVNDALGSVFAVVVLRLISAHAVDAAIPLHEVASAFAIAIVGGAVAGLVWMRLLRELRDHSYEYVLSLAAALFLYAAASYVGGNGAISVLVFGLVLGNAEEISRALSGVKQQPRPRVLYAFEEEVVFFVRTFFFVYIGLIFQPSASLDVILLAVAVMAAILASRTASMKALAPKAEDYLLQGFVIPIGLSAVVLSVLPSAFGVSIPGVAQVVLFVVVFTNVVTAAAVFLQTSTPKPLRSLAAPRKPRIVGFEQKRF